MTYLKNLSLSVFPLTAALVLFGPVSLSSQATAAAPLEGTQPAHWRVTWTDNPATTATVSWSTREQGSKHTLRYRTKDQSPKTDAIAMAQSGQFTGGKEKLYYHHVHLTDLEPSTAYEVQMNSDADQSPWFYFVTGPDHDRSFSLLNGGDSRSGQKYRLLMNQMMADMVSESLRNDDKSDDILALVHGGDYIQSGRDMSQWTRWLSDHETTVGDDGRLLPVIPARGNHDVGKPFNQVFGFPEGDTNYYAISIGPQVRMVTLNSEVSVAGDQATWIESELKQARKSHRWLLAQYHRPIYPSVKTPGPALGIWAPLFEKYNVDLACEADGHNIKRTVPIRDNAEDPTGVVYIGEGGLGVGQRTPKTDRWYLKSPGMADLGHHVFVLTFKEDKLEGKCVLLNGTIRDEFTRPRRVLEAETAKVSALVK